MFLIRAIQTDEDALLCDLAETYHIYTIEGLSCSYLATLVVGLKDNSRIKMKMSGMKIPVETFLMASMVDHLAFLSWTKTKDAEKGKNRPQSILSVLLGKNDKPKDKRSFTSFDDFLKEWYEE